MAFDNILIFEEGTSSMSFGSTVSFEDGDSLSFEFKTDAPDSVQMTLFSDTSGADLIEFGYFDDFSVVINSTRYNLPSIDTTGLFDGEWHDITISRSGSGFGLTADGSLLGTLNASSTAMQINKITFETSTTTDYTSYLRNNLVISGETWDLSESSPISSSPSAVTLTLTDVTQYSISEWEWVGELMYMDRTVNSYNATRQERRNEGTRSRIVKGIDMGNTILAQKGTSETSVPAFNAGLESNLVGVANFTSGTANPVCEEERFIPFHGTEFYRQTQRWIAYSFSDS